MLSRMRTLSAALAAVALAGCAGPVQQSGYDVAETQVPAAAKTVQTTAAFQFNGNILLPPNTNATNLVVYVRDTAGNLYTATGVTLTPAAAEQPLGQAAQ